MDARELIFSLHKHDAIPPIGKLPGLWERKLDDRWTIWINGQKEALLAPSGMKIQPGDCYVEFNGWPAGIFNVITGEGTIAAGSAANYETFCEALQKAVESGGVA